MKGINVRKIAAFAGAAVLGLSAVAVADVVYGNTQLVDQNGQPTVKIYVGSKAAISDGVAAANIAAKIANEAYKSSTLTATMSGTPTCTVGSGVSGAGTCSIVESSKKVTLSVTVPGVVAGAHTFKTLITDTIDRALANRISTKEEDKYNSTLSSPDTSSVTTPLRGVANDPISTNLYRIGASQFTGFADTQVKDYQATGSGSTYTVQQSFWVGSSNDAVKYDSDSSIRDVAVNTYTAMAYSVKFAGNDFGVPVCTGDLNSSISDDWTSCGTESNARTEKHRVEIPFMGSKWIISELKDPNIDPHPDETSVKKGGQIKLAKEAKYGIINVGQTLDAGDFKIKLSDISVAVGQENKHPAIIDVLDANDAVVGQIQVDPGTTYTFTQSGTGKSVKIHVYKTAPGFTLNAKWAEMAIYSDEITLKDGSRYNLVPSNDVDKNFKVSLLWKNRDRASGSSNKSDSLREIVVYDIDTFSGNKYKAGDTYSFLKSKPTFKLTYDGLDLTDDDYEVLTLNAVSQSTYRVATAEGDNAVCQPNSADDLSYIAKLIRIKTPGGNYLGGTGLLGSNMVDTVLFDPVGVAGPANSSPNGTQNLSHYNTPNAKPKVFFQLPGKDCWNWKNLTLESAPASGISSLANAVKFEKAGENSAAYGAIFFTNNTANMGFGNGAVVLQEDAGKNDTNSNTKVLTAFPFNTTSSGTDPFKFKSSDSATSKVAYLGVRDSAFAEKELKFVTERGSQVTNVGSTDASMKVAKRVGMASFTFATADTASNPSGAVDYTLGVGESKVFGGVTVLVKAIDATAGSCSVLGPGGAPACTVDAASLKPVISPDNTASVVVSQPYALTSKLVYTDAEAKGAGAAILVGGPMVNTLTADALKGSEIDLKKDGPVVKEISTGKIVVAGYTAEETLAAADQFIAGIKRK
ncbi:MAG: S-layer protein [Candidatus Micrarchaeota archaeon]|nr:S-layer protein [Candidatus Micrarchaeota archaeon]